MRNTFSLFLLVLLATSLGCAARTSAPRSGLDTGDRVRVSAMTESFVGRLSAMDADTLFLQPRIALPLASVTKVEVSRGRRARPARGAGIGLLAGAALGATLGALAGGGFGECYLGDDPPEGETSGCSGFFALVGGAGFGLLGTLIGAGVGAANSVEIWEEVTLEKIQAQK